ncbi:MAG TPA: Ig-like domain-containing protein, partial [Pyrinomonadaceae bacterium]|nr:Ig-like domain-containing protein [Pyrinomonadaceae bacterium]
MPLDEKRPGITHKTLSYRKYPKFNKASKSATLLIAVIALVTAIAFSVSVESRTAGWLWKTQPSAPPSKAEPAKNSTAPSASASAYQPLGPNAALLTPVAPTVTASKTDALITDVDMDGKADPGDTLKYTVSIGVSGMDATGVQFTDTVDPNTAFVAGTLRTTPIARNDSYTATGNVRITVAAPGVLGNDSDADPAVNALTATAGTFLSANGGDVNLSSDGSFTYNPPAGFEGNDSFTYTLNDNDGEGATDTATVSITVSGMIWFINNNASCPCDGRLTNPFNSLAAFQAVNDGGNSGLHPSANDNIFVYESATDYVGPVTLLNGQKFIGQDATASLATIAGITLAPGSDPLPATNSGNGTIVNITSASAGINLGQNNTLRGFTGGNAAPDINGSGFGTAAISDITLNGNGQALNLTNGTLSPAATFGSISSANSATTGLSLTTVAGSLTTGSTTITNSTGIGISVNTSSLTLGFANTSVTGSGGTGVSLTTNTGAITFGDLDISPDAGQRGLLATDNTQTITATSGTIATTTGTAVEITRASSTTPLAIVFTSVSNSGAPNGIMLRNTSGSFTLVGDGANTAVGGNFTGGTISNATGADGATSGNGVYLENAGNVTLRRIRVNGTNQNHGIRGVNSSNFTLEFSTVTGTNGTSAANDEGSVNFSNLTGTAAITSCSID